MAASEVGLLYQRSDGSKNDGKVTWCKHVCGFPQPRIYHAEYKDWQNTMKLKMEQERMPSWKGSTAARCTAIQAYALATLPVTVGAALWERDRARSEHFTECLDSLLKEIAKKHKPSLT